MPTAYQFPSSPDHFYEELKADPELNYLWNQLSDAAKSEFLSYYLGEKLIPITYDRIFKHLFDPQTHPERLSELLSLILEEPVSVVQALPNEGRTQSLYSKGVIFDLIVRFQDGRLANVEMQRISYDCHDMLLAERAAYCISPIRSVVYSSSLVLNQYSRLQAGHIKKANLEQVKKVYVIILLETSYPAFHTSPFYIHKSHQVFNSGVTLDMLQEYVYVELGKFRETVKTLDTRLNAWFRLLLSRTPHDILEIISHFPDFQNIYNDVIIFTNEKKELMTMIPDPEFMNLLVENSIEHTLQRLENEKAELEIRANKLLSENDRLKKTILELRTRLERSSL